MYKKGTGNDKQGKDAGNRTLCPYRNFSQAISKCTESFIFHFYPSYVNGFKKFLWDGEFNLLHYKFTDAFFNFALDVADI